MEMSATPRMAEALREDEHDTSNNVLGKRWLAEKRARLTSEDPDADEEAARGGVGALIKGLVREARALRDRRRPESSA